MARIETTVRMGISRSNQGHMSIEIHDEHSGELIADLQMSAKELGLLVTGLHGVKATGVVESEPVLAKRRVCKEEFCERVDGEFCERVDGRDKIKQHDVVVADMMAKYPNGDVFLQNDGTTSKQSGDKHRYMVKWYEDVEDPFEVDRYY